MITKTLTTIIAVTLGGGLFAQLPNNLLAPLGNVGVGTLTPTSKLQVIGNSDFTGNFSLTGDATLNGTTTLTNLRLPSLNLTIAAANLEFVVRDPLNGNIEKAGSDILRSVVYAEPAFPCFVPVAPNGTPLPVYPTWSNGPSKIFVRCPDDAKVGIGTNDPLTKLDVTGVVRATGLNIGVTPTNAQARVHIYHAALENSNTKVLLIENATRKLMQLDNSGLLHAREVKLDVVSWPDYVFEPNYTVMAPAEIKTFIAEHHHLPGVPSAAEMEQNGMDVMAMNAILLKKIEELTLLLLQQQEQINALNNEIRH